MSSVNYFIDIVHDNIDDFDSGYPVFNSYLKHRSDSAVMHYIIDVETEALIAYFSLLSSAAIIGNLDNLEVIPAIELKMFAVDKRFQKKGLRLFFLNPLLKS